MATVNPPPMTGLPPLQPGQQPTPEQIREIQRQIAEEAQKHGMTVQEYVERLKAQAMQQHQAQMRMQQMQQQQQQSGQPVVQQQAQGQPQQQQPQPQQIPINTQAPPKPEAVAIANFLKTQDLKPRTCLFNSQRKELFRVKRAIRALMSPAYGKARAKNPLLPEVNDRVTAENTFKMLPMSMLALRVSKHDEHEGHDHAKKKTKGLWTVKVEPQQEAHDDMYYCWLYEGSQWKTKLYAGGALALILAVVFFPIWPYKLRLGVWYLSMGCLGLLGLFFAMAIFRLILFVITTFAVPPGIWLYPNLFEDVGFFDSFKPFWGWQDTAESLKAAKAAKKAKKQARAERRALREQASGDEEQEEEAEEEGEEEEEEAHEHGDIEEVEDEEAEGSGEETQESGAATGADVVQQQKAYQRIAQSASVEEVDDDE